MNFDGKKLVPAGAFGVSLVIHLGILLMIGGIVLIERVVPKMNMTGELTYSESLPDTGQPETTDEPESEPLSNEPANETPAITAADPGSPMDLIATEISSPNQTLVTSAPGAAMSLGTSTGFGSGSQGQGTGKLSLPKGKASSINFFGVKGSAQRVAFLLDASGSMVTVQRGGKEGYAKLKQDFLKMVESLDPETSFCAFIYDSTVDQFRSSDVLATPENKKAFAEWLAPYMTKSFGNVLHNYSTKRLQGYNGTTRMDLALTAALESGCDTIFILTDGTPSVYRPLTEKELSDWQKLHDRNIKEIEAFGVVQKEYNEKYRSEIAEMQLELKKRNAAVDGRQAEVEYWIEGFKGIPPRPTPKAIPGLWKPQPRMSGDDLVDYLMATYREVYVPINQQKPCVHIVGYGVNEEERNFLKKMSKQFSGSYADFKFEK